MLGLLLVSLLAPGLTLVAPASAQAPQVFVVDSIGDDDDASPGDGSCATSFGACTLRAAIREANAWPGADEIHFAIGAGPVTISPGTLPAITESVTIDGSTQPGFTVAPIVHLTGGGAELQLQGSGSRIHALSITAVSSGQAIRLLGTGGHTVTGSYLGLMPDGTTTSANHEGIRVESSGNRIGGATASERNVISGNNLHGIAFFSPSIAITGNLVLGNHIGTDATGLVARGNGGAGIVFAGAVQGATVGGVVPGEGNVIAANGQGGIRTDAPTATMVQILGNLIGTDAQGLVALGNTGNGIGLSSSLNAVGAPGTGRNVISANTGDGIWINGAGTTGNAIRNNLIGITSTGIASLGNGGVGVRIVNGAYQNIVGGTDPSERNVVSANANGGVRITGDASDGNAIFGNFIGTDGTGSVALGNGWFGIQVDDADDTGIHQNVVSGNGAPTEYGIGISLNGASWSVIQSNLIGTDASGRRPLGNWGEGVELLGGSTGTMIGGDATSWRNVISANLGCGIGLYGNSEVPVSSNIIQGNLIGVAIDRSTPLGNGCAGIDLYEASDNAIGGVWPGERNLIAHNGDEGIRIEGMGQPNTIDGNSIWNNGAAGVAVVGAGTSALIRGNRMRANAGIPIDLAADGATANDPDDADAGPNDLLNFPVISSATLAADGSFAVSGTVPTPTNGDGVRIEYYLAHTCTADDGGEPFLVGDDLESGGPFSFQTTVSPIPFAKVLRSTATAVNVDNTPLFTSEVSDCFTLVRESLGACDDALHDDDDGLAAYPVDPGCLNPADNDEEDCLPMTSSGYEGCFIDFGPRVPVDPALHLLQDEEFSQAIPLGFPFPYFGRDITHVFVSSNGFVHLAASADEDPVNDYDAQGFPDPSEPNNLIAPMWDDYDPAAGGAVRTWNTGTELVVEFDEVAMWDWQESSVKFQLVLQAGGAFEAHIDHTGLPGAPLITDHLTSGFEDCRGEEGLLLFASASVAKRAWRVTPPAEQPGSCVPVDGLRFAADATTAAVAQQPFELAVELLAGNERALGATAAIDLYEIPEYVDPGDFLLECGECEVIQCDGLCTGTDFLGSVSAQDGVATFTGLQLAPGLHVLEAVLEVDGQWLSAFHNVTVVAGAPAHVELVSFPGSPLLAGEPFHATARVTDAHGNPVDGVSVSLAASGPGALQGMSAGPTVAGERTFTGLSLPGPGDYLLRAVVTGLPGSPAVDVFVNPSAATAVDSIQVTLTKPDGTPLPANATGAPVVVAGALARVHAKAFVGSAQQPGLRFSFEVDPPQAAYVDGDGILHAFRTGPATVTARVDGDTASDPFDFTIVAGPAAALLIDPRAAVVGPGEDVTFSLDVQDAAGNPLPLDDPRWTFKDAAAGGGDTLAVVGPEARSGPYVVNATANGLGAAAFLFVLTDTTVVQAGDKLELDVTMQTIQVRDAQGGAADVTQYAAAVAGAQAGALLDLDPAVVSGSALLDQVTVTLDRSVSDFALLIETRLAGDGVPLELDPASLGDELEDVAGGREAALFIHVSATEGGATLDPEDLNARLGRMVLRFQVPQAYFTANGFDPASVRLIEFSDGDLQERTIFAQRDPAGEATLGSFVYEAIIDDFSTFAVVGASIAAAVGGGGGGGGGAESTNAAGAILLPTGDRNVPTLEVLLKAGTDRSKVVRGQVYHQLTGAPATAKPLPRAVQATHFMEVELQGEPEDVREVAFQVSLAPADVPDPERALLLHLKDDVWVPEGMLALDLKDGRYVGRVASTCCSAFAIAFDLEAPTLKATIPTGTVSGLVPILVAPDDNLGVASVSVLDATGRELARDLAAPFDLVLATASLDEGLFNLTVVARDWGNQTASVAGAFNVKHATIDPDDLSASVAANPGWGPWLVALAFAALGIPLAVLLGRRNRRSASPALVISPPQGDDPIEVLPAVPEPMPLPPGAPTDAELAKARRAAVRRKAHSPAKKAKRKGKGTKDRKTGRPKGGRRTGQHRSKGKPRKD